MALGSNSLTQHTVEQLRRHAPFDHMEPEHLQWLAERLQVGYYAKGELILSPQQGVASRFFIVKQGEVIGKQGLLPNDEEAVVHELQEGECFPFGALLSKRPVTSTYRAFEDVFCFELPADDFHELCRMSDVFHDFCTRRIGNLLEYSAHVVQAQYSQSSTELQSMSSPLSAVVRREPVTCSPQTPVRQVLETMHEMGIGSMVAVDEGLPVGIFTLHDVLNRVALPQIDLDQPIIGLMSTSLCTLSPQALAYEAALAMVQHGLRHILVADKGKLTGVVSEKDLFALQRVGLRQISTAIRGARNLESLKQSGKDIRQLAHNMLAQGVGAEPLTQFISTLNDLLTIRIIELELERAREEKNWVDIDFCWLALGSEGRFEQTLSTDQDNGIIFVTPPHSTPAQIRSRLLPLATAINVALDACGFPLCKGGIMASNPKWCLSREEWENTFSQWISRGDSEELLNASIFFDFRPLFGNKELAYQLRAWLNGKVRNNRMFLRKMVENALGNRPPLSMLRNFLLKKKGANPNTLDLKINGVTPFVDAARIFALAAGSGETGTTSRLRAACETWRMDKAETEAWTESFLYIQLFRLRLQHQQVEGASILSNRVNPDNLNALDRHILKETFHQARILQGVLEKYFTF
jgi:CBS domain-containing protein